MFEGLEKEQKIQERAYQIPYHWCTEKTDYGGRIYFGYLSLCLDFLKKYNNDLSKVKVLEAGCGDGRFLCELKKTGAEDLYGIDYSERAISFAKIFVPKANIQTADIKSLPYEDGFFDTIFLIEVLEHIKLDEVGSVLSELSRVLKKEGQLIITVPSKNVPVGSKHYQHFTPESLMFNLKDSFEIRDIVGQDKSGFSIAGFFYKFLDNRYWVFKKLSALYNTDIWFRMFNKCEPEKGKRLVAFCVKK
jgi:SAM-dependent methyltransferase